MDVDADPCGSNNFYDEIASFMPQPGDYTLDDLDEILRSADSQLDTSFDFTSLMPPSVHDFDVGALDAQQYEAPAGLQQDDYKFDISVYPSPASSNHSPRYETTQSQRSTSTSSVDDDTFNPDDFMNFFTNDDIKIEEIPNDVPDTVMDEELPRRSTPSPTGSCSSSGGSSTSGVHSDFSSVVSDQMTTFMIQDELERSHNVVPAAKIVNAPSAVTNLVAPTATVLPISILPLPQVQPVTLIPVKTVPIASIKSVNGLKTPTTSPAPASIGKVEPKLAPKVITVQQSANIVMPAKSSSTAILATSSKMTPPPNAKPKTIFLSSKDFKTLMQKMNSNGGAAKGAKITGGFNGQMPKIIMKTASGKVITANKLVQPLGSNSVPTMQQPTQQQFVPKIIKAHGPHIIKHQPQHQHTKVIAVGNAIAVAAARAGISTSSTHSMPDLSIYKGIIDDKMYKKQQRMIKNRESASLSRKKKKEYVVSLESRINNLEKENYTLKGENTSLRSQLMAYAQTCQCKHSNISEFILNSLNMSTKGHHNSTSEHHHVKIAPKPAPKSLKQRMTAANVRKNVAVLFAMAFMVTLNVGNFQTYFNKNSIESSIEAAGEAAAATSGSAEALAAGRQLLWVESETEFHEKLNRSKRETDLEVPPPPLHFLRPINRTATFGDDMAQETPLNCSSSAVGSGNQTEENMRLVNKLHKWIDGNDYLNLSLRKQFDNDLDNSLGFKLSPDYLEWNSIELQTGPGSKKNRKIIIQRPQYENKKRKLDLNVDLGNEKHNGNGNIINNDKGNSNDPNSLELFKPKLSEEYVRLFNGIKRQDDTFYVLSFNMDHILLPASVYNKSARPKMSLMLPAGDPSLNGDIVLMQIDCEVMNTTELELKSHMIPEKLRPSKYKNENTAAEANSTDVANNETRVPDAMLQQRSYMPAPAPAVTKERPPLPRTYFMMGPKTQAAMKKKPTIVKLNGNDSVSYLTALNVKNSTLFAKMRETIESDVTP